MPNGLLSARNASVSAEKKKHLNDDRDTGKIQL